MAVDNSKLLNIVGKLAGDVQTLISIARKGTNDPTEQAVIDQIEQSLEAVDNAVVNANAELGGATGPTGTTGATGPDGSTGATGA